MIDNSIIERIKKLLSLATSSNEHEASLASSKATELLTKYNLDIQELGGDSLYLEDIMDEGKRQAPEDLFVDGLLNKHFNVKVLVDKTSIGKVIIRVVGTPTNVEIATYAHTFLKRTFKELFKTYKKETGCSGKARKSYYMGLYRGFSEKMEESKKRVEESRGLVLRPDVGLKRKLNELYPNSRWSNSRVNNNDSSAYASGMKDGRNINFSKGIHSNGGNSGRYLK